MDTIGSLVDKLTVTNLKLWFVQEKVHEASKAGEGLDAETTRRLTALNLQRNDLMREIDELVNESIAAGGTPVDQRIKLV